MKRFQVLTLSLVMIFSLLLSGCRFSLEDISTRLNQDKLYEEKAEAVYQALKDRDEEKLKELISPYSLDTTDVDGKIQEAFDFIDGNIVSYDIMRNTGESESIRDGKAVRLNNCMYIEEIVTDSGSMYDVSVQIVLVYEENENWEGVNRIDVCELDEDGERNYDTMCTIGEVFDY